MVHPSEQTTRYQTWSDGNRPGSIRFHVESRDHKLNVVHHEVNLDLLSRIESREAWISAPIRARTRENETRLERTHPCTDNWRI